MEEVERRNIYASDARKYSVMELCRIREMCASKAASGYYGYAEMQRRYGVAIIDIDAETGSDGLCRIGHDLEAANMRAGLRPDDLPGLDGVTIEGIALRELVRIHEEGPHDESGHAKIAADAMFASGLDPFAYKVWSHVGTMMTAHPLYKALGLIGIDEIRARFEERMLSPTLSNTVSMAIEIVTARKVADLRRRHAESSWLREGRSAAVVESELADGLDKARSLARAECHDLILGQIVLDDISRRIAIADSGRAP